MRQVFERSILNSIVFRWIGLQDLDIALITNRSDLDFIFSDHPVIFSNLKYHNPKGDSRGISRSGLTVFFPINSKKMVALYDKEIYSLKCKVNKIDLTKKKDIVLLNTLQLFNCYQYLYSATEKESIYMIKIFKNNKSKVEKTRGKISFIKSSRYFHKLDSYYNPKFLSFINQTDFEREGNLRDSAHYERMMSIAKFYNKKSDQVEEKKKSHSPSQDGFTPIPIKINYPEPLKYGKTEKNASIGDLKLPIPFTDIKFEITHRELYIFLLGIFVGIIITIGALLGINFTFG